MSEIGTSNGKPTAIRMTSLTFTIGGIIIIRIRYFLLSYFEKWNFHTGFFKFLKNNKNTKCDIYIHMDSLDKAREVLGDMLKN